MRKVGRAAAIRVAVSRVDGCVAQQDIAEGDALFSVRVAGWALLAAECK